jgi:uroporphyrinogen III methyltransferase / synthase
MRQPPNQHNDQAFLMRPTLIITRPSAQAAPLLAQLKAMHYPAIGFPLLTIQATPHPEALISALNTLEKYACAVMVSPNAVDYAVTALTRLGKKWPQQVPIAVVGPGSLLTLKEHGIDTSTYTIIAPKGATQNDDKEKPRFDSEALWSSLETAGFNPDTLSGKQVLIIRGQGGRTWLAEQFARCQAKVTAVEAYHRNGPETLTPEEWTAFTALLDTPHIWHISSSEALRFLDELLHAHFSPEKCQHFKQSPIWVSHLRIAETAQNLGFHAVHLIAPGDSGLIAEIIKT